MELLSVITNVNRDIFRGSRVVFDIARKDGYKVCVIVPILADFQSYGITVELLKGVKFSIVESTTEPPENAIISYCRGSALCEIVGIDKRIGLYSWLPKYLTLSEQ